MTAFNTISRLPSAQRLVSYLLMLLTAVLITGCTPVKKTPPAPPAPPVTVDDIASHFEDLQLMWRQMCLAPQYALYFEKTPCVPELATDKQLNDPTFITADERVVMQRVLSETQMINERTLSLMQQTDLPAMKKAVDSAQTQSQAIRANQAALLSQSITWGEYNRQRQALTLKRDETLTSSDEDTVSDVQTQSERAADEIKPGTSK